MMVTIAGRAGCVTGGGGKFTTFRWVGPGPEEFSVL